MRGVVALASKAVAAQGSDTCRILVVKDTSANGVLPAVTDILALANYESFPNLENKNRFRIIADKMISINCEGISDDGTTIRTAPHEVHFSIFRKINFPIEYNDGAATGVIDTINTNNVVMVIISRVGFCAVEACVRFRYTDM